ncbi:MAG: TetR family transcriptional regulator C-terminal domain-containing protein, partial [Gorillibacterium sp.]|nr:TetR family transcriptional regulator C-terminal domain-containing protein [Gorillibacterium sp.]
ILSREEKNNYESACMYFAYFRKHDRLIRNLNNSKLTHLILERCTGFLHSLFQDIVFMRSYSPEKDRYCIEFLAGGFYKVLMEWAKSGMQESDEAMAMIVCDLIKE